MASTFPAAIASEPPPLDISSEEEDSEEFRSHGLKLDVPSGEPTPVSTPFKRPHIKSPGKRKSLPDSDSGTGTPSIDNIDEDDAVLELTSTSLKDISSPENTSPVKKDNGIDFQFLNHNVDDSGTDEEISCTNVSEVNIQDIVTTTSHQISDFTAPIKEECVPICASKSEESAANINTDNSNCDNEESASTRLEQIYDSQDCEADKKTAIPTSLSSEESTEVQIGSVKENCVEPVEHEPRVDVEESFNEVVDIPCVATEQNLSKEDHFSNPQETPEDPNDDFDDFSIAQQIVSHKVENDNEVIEPRSKEIVAAEIVTNDYTDHDGAAKSVEDDFDDDDFGAFQSIPSEYPSNPNEAAPLAEDDEDDDFGDFAQVPAQNQNQPQNVSCVPSLSTQPSFEDSGDFADFKDCSFQSFQAHLNPQTSSDISRISSKVETLVKSLFVIESTPAEDNDNNKEKLKSIDTEISNTNENLWARVQDFEGSRGLMFKWLNCLTEKHLLKSLNIDNSNIMYHEKWGTIEVPKFAASLVQSPLQPQSCTNQLDPLMKVDAHHSLVNNNNNNVTDDGISCQDHDKPPAISVEAQEILRQLPDLSYMRANTLVFPQSSPSGI